jgi:hypothetical protein
MNKKSESLEFKCHKCGSNKLACIKRVYCVTPVEIISNGQLSDGPAVIIDTDEYSNNTEKFQCRDCETPLVYRHWYVRTEKELWECLKYFADSTGEGSSQEHTLDLMARVEEDGFIRLNSKEDK